MRLSSSAAWRNETQDFPKQGSFCPATCFQNTPYDGVDPSSRVGFRCSLLDVRIIGITSAKGGVGKSAIACQLACHLSRTFGTCVVDSDVNRSSLAFHRRGSHAWNAVPVHAAAAATRQAELVILDTAGGDRIAMAEVAQGADFVLVPTTPTPAAVQVTLETAATFIDSGTPWGVVLTMVDARRPADAQGAAELLRAHQLPVLPVQTTLLAVWQKAEALGCPLADAPDSNRATAAEQIRRLAELVT